MCRSINRTKQKLNIVFVSVYNQLTTLSTSAIESLHLHYINIIVVDDKIEQGGVNFKLNTFRINHQSDT